MSELIQRVYNDADNVFNLVFTYVDDSGVEQELDTSNIARSVLTIYGGNSGSDVTLDSDVVAGISWNDTGTFTAAIGDQSIDVGEFYAGLRVYDSGHPDGQWLIHRWSENKLKLMVVAS